MPDKHVSHLYVHRKRGTVLGGHQIVQHALIVVFGKVQLRLVHGAQALATHLTLSKRLIISVVAEIE